MSGSAPLVVFGDSHTQGTGASRPGRAYARLLAEDLGLPLVQLGYGGTGYVHVGPRRGLRRGGVLGDFAGKVPAQRALLVIQLPAHDRDCDIDEVRATVDTVFTGFGSGPALVFGPLWAKTDRHLLPGLRELGSDAAAQHGFDHVDASDWITPDLVGPDGAHFTDAGHAAVARRLGASIRERGLVPQS